jgi:hypothetical protein
VKERRASSVSREFNAASFFWRLGASLILVLSTYNPTQLSFYRWVRAGMADGGLGPEHFVAGILLIIGWSILVVATQKSLGTIGFVLAAALVGGLVWWFTGLPWFNVDSVSALTWVSLVCLSVVLAIGLSWSHVWRRITGQYEVDDNDT